MAYRPPFELTSEMLELVAELMRLVGRVESLPSAVPQPKLRRGNRIRTVQATLAIEGSSVSPEQVTSILDGRRVIGGRAEIREVENAIGAYDTVGDLDPTKVADLLKAHGQLLAGLIPDAGRFRRGNVGVLQGKRVAHVAPPAGRVPALVGQLLEFVRRDRTVHPILKALIAHYAIEFIHPFSDGNGRIGRLWQHRLLMDVHPIFAHAPVESVVRARQKEYYAALGKADRAGDLGPFLELALEVTRDALAELVRELRPEPATGESRLERARAELGDREFSRAEYAALFPTMSSATASRDLRAGVDAKVLARRGTTATARYRFR